MTIKKGSILKKNLTLVIALLSFTKIYSAAVETKSSAATALEISETESSSFKCVDSVDAFQATTALVKFFEKNQENISIPIEKFLNLIQEIPEFASFPEETRAWVLQPLSDSYFIGSSKKSSSYNWTCSKIRTRLGLAKRTST